MKIRGRVVHLDLEGGFWGIEGDDGERYYPVDGLPGDVRREGCRISAEAEPAGVVSYRMWGRNVRLHDVKEIR